MEHDDLDYEEEKPVWGSSFMKTFQFRIEFGKKAEDGRRYLPDGTSPVATVVVESWSIGSAKRAAIAEARHLYRNRPMVLQADVEAKGYQVKYEG